MDKEQRLADVAKVLRRWFGIGFNKQMTPAREVLEILNAQESGCKHDGGWVKNEVCTWCAICGKDYPETHKEITKRVIEEYLRWFKEQEFFFIKPTIRHCKRWLQQEEDGN